MEHSIVRVWIAEKHRPAVDTRQGRSFDLKEPTYFYGANTSWEPPSALEPTNTSCSWELFFAIRRLVEDYDASL